MKLTILGNSSPYPAPSGACSGYLIEDDNFKILLECGNGVLGNLQKYCKIWDLDAVIISHLHTDHCGDLFPLRYAMRTGFFYKYRKDKLPVFITKRPTEKFFPFSQFSDYFDYIFYEDYPENIKSIKFKDLELEFYEMEHIIPAYAVSLNKNGKKIVFSSDTGYTSTLETIAKNADLFLCEATVLKRDGDYAVGRHLTTVQAGEVARNAGVKRFLPTHFFPEYNLTDIKNEIEQGYKGRVEITSPGKTYEV